MSASTFNTIAIPYDAPHTGFMGPWRVVRATVNRMFPDRALVERARHGDRGAFDALTARYQKRLHTLAMLSIGDNGLIGDPMCETVLAAFHDVESFAAKVAPGTWLYQHGLRSVFVEVGAALA